MSIDAWKSQLRKGAAELVVLALLKEGDSYGFAIIEALADASSINLSEGSIYPLLNRLRREKKVEPYWVENEKTGLRKYYRLTQQGQATLSVMKKEWQLFSYQIQKLLGEKNDAR